VGNRLKALDNPRDADLSWRLGDIYSFRTTCVPRSLRSETNRFAALKVIGVAGSRVCFVVLEGIFDRHPTLTAVQRLPWLRNTRFVSAGDPACCWTITDEFRPRNIRLAGNVGVTDDERALAENCRARSTLNAAATFAEAEWRWRNDHEAFVRDMEADRRAEDVLREERVRARKERLKNLTWEGFAEQDLFHSWTSHPPFPPLEFTNLARERIRDVAKQLQSIGSNVTRAQVRDIVRNCVEWFNRKNLEFGEVIETEEREDLIQILEDLAAVAGHPSVASEVDRWRRW